MQPKKIAITKILSDKGYKNPKNTLSNWIGGILKEKEDFKRFLFDDRENKVGRVEKIIINEDGEILVENLAILNQFSRLFGKAQPGQSGEYVPYRYLKTKIDRADFSSKVLKQSKTIEADIYRSNQSATNLSIFANSILSNTHIDITKQSLRGLMNENINSKALLDVENSYELGEWNQLMLLRERENDGDIDSGLYLEIAEKLLNINEVEQAIEALEKSIELDSENGVTWAIYAKTMYSILKNHHQEHYNVRARMEFSESIANPITSEERWLNERAEETSEKILTTHDIFIQAAVKGLKFWPSWEYSSSERENYQPNLNLSSKTTFDFKRADLFLMLIERLNVHDFQNHQDLINVIRSFQQWNPELYPLTNIGIYDTRNSYFNFKVKIIEVFCWISKEDEERVIDKLISDFKENSYAASENLAILKSSKVSDIFWDYLGADNFKELYEILESFISDKRESEKLDTLSQLRLMDIMSSFYKLNQGREQVSISYFGCAPKNKTEKPIEFYLDESQMIQRKEWVEDIQKAVEISANIVAAQHVLIKQPDSDNISLRFHAEVLNFLAPLIKLVNGDISESNIHILINYIKKRYELKNVICHINSKIIDVFELIDLIPWTKLNDEQNTNLNLLIDIVREVYQEIEDDMDYL